jgi:hypothetical protein
MDIPDRYLVLWCNSELSYSLQYLVSCLSLIQLISLIWGYNWHIFRPDETVNVDSEEYPLLVLIKQISVFWPGPPPLPGNRRR